MRLLAKVRRSFAQQWNAALQSQYKGPAHLLNVLLTVDCEISSRRYAKDRQHGLEPEISRALYGRTKTGSYGIPYQIAVLNEHRLKAVFFVESLFASVVGPEPLKKIVGLIHGNNHEVQLHVHPEWLSEVTPREGKYVKNLKDMTEDEQFECISRARENLYAAGVEEIRAFRAGNAGAGFNTLRALARLGISYDSSYLVSSLRTDCGLRMPKLLCQPAVIEGVIEFPISFFRDWPGHYRPLQLCACSTSEMESALMQAWQRGWKYVVVLWHSFELLKRSPIRAGIPHFSSRLLINRFQHLCRFLSEHRDKFQTVGFGESDSEIDSSTHALQPLRSNVLRTSWRMAQQLAGDFL